MSKSRVFKTKTFARWAKKLISDDLLCQAAHEIERGEFEADLGQGVCKKRRLARSRKERLYPFASGETAQVSNFLPCRSRKE
jgi:hypothetical protein